MIRKVLLAVTAAGLLAQARARLARRRRHLMLMPVGITKAAGLTMKESLRMSQLRELALHGPVGRPAIRPRSEQW